MMLSLWIGYDPREAEAFAVARNSARQFNRGIPIFGLVLRDLQDRGLYSRPTRKRLGRLWDDISDAHMSTEFAISRFLVPHLAEGIGGWAIFTDCDVLFRANPGELRQYLKSEYALCCVKHDHKPINIEKMDGQAQTVYPRKNWSSVMAFNLGHPSNKALTVEMVNALPGRDLHRFCWLKDEEIGELPPEWNYLVGHTAGVESPKIVHFTEGGPWLGAFEEVEYAGEWFKERDRWAK
jgi:hypothetical protein